MKSSINMLLPQHNLTLIFQHGCIISTVVLLIKNCIIAFLVLRLLWLCNFGPSFSIMQKSDPSSFPTVSIGWSLCQFINFFLLMWRNHMWHNVSKILTQTHAPIVFSFCDLVVVKDQNPTAKNHWEKKIWTYKTPYMCFPSQHSPATYKQKTLVNWQSNSCQLAPEKKWET